MYGDTEYYYSIFVPFSFHARSTGESARKGITRVRIPHHRPAVPLVIHSSEASRSSSPSACIPTWSKQALGMADAIVRTKFAWLHAALARAGIAATGQRAALIGPHGSGRRLRCAGVCIAPGRACQLHSFPQPFPTLCRRDGQVSCPVV